MTPTTRAKCGRAARAAELSWPHIARYWANNRCDTPCRAIQKRFGDPNPQYFSKSTAVQMGGVLQYKWEAYCSTNGRRIAGFPFLRSLEARKVLPYNWGAHCRTNWRCIAVLSPRPVGVGVSETLPSDTLSGISVLTQNGAMPPPLGTEFHTGTSVRYPILLHIGDNGATPPKTRTDEFCDTIAGSIAQYEKYRCWAS